MTTTPKIPTPKERFLGNEQSAREWTDLMFSARSREAIDAALLDYIQSLPLTDGMNSATSGLMIRGAIGFSRHLALIGVARTLPTAEKSSELEPFDPVKAELDLQRKLQKQTQPS